MLSQDIKKLRRYCKDGIASVENYDKAISDDDNMWELHHRDEVRTLPSGMVVVRTSRELIEEGRYWHCPANELIFMKKAEHQAMHAHYQIITSEARARMRVAKLGKSGPRLGKPVSLEQREKLRAAQTGKRLSPETRRKISEANFKRWAVRRAASA